MLKPRKIIRDYTPDYKALDTLDKQTKVIQDLYDQVSEFYRFISENIEKYINENQIKSGDKNFKYRDLSDEIAIMAKEQILQEKGLFILPSQLFCNVKETAKNDHDLNVTVFNIFKSIEESANGMPSEKDVKGLFGDFDVNSNKLGATVEERNEKLVQML